MVIQQRGSHSMTIISVLTQKEQQMFKASSAWRFSDHSEGTQANNPLPNPLPKQFRKSTELLSFFFPFSN